MVSNLLKNSGLTKDPEWSRFLTRWLTIAFCLHLIAGIWSSGFYHADEHFQILEFLNAKLGKSPIQDLPLEFRHFMRPWLLPALFYGITVPLKSLGLQNPFEWALIYRLFASFLGWLSLAGLALCCYSWFPSAKWRNRAVMAMTLLWYMPAFHARHSSENLGGSVFFIGLTLILLASPSSPGTKSPLRELPAGVGFISGILFGISFEFRYQLGVMVAGTFLWLLCIARLSLKQYLPLLLGILTSVALGTLADRWGYGEWTCAPWNYFEFNLVQNHVSDADTTPWWDYFRRAFTESWPLIGFLLLLSFPVAWALFPKHSLTWSMAPLFLVHGLIGHKELRFLFPLIHAGGILLMWVLSATEEKFQAQPPQWLPSFFLRLSQFLLFLNLVGLFSLTLLPAWMPIRFYQQLYSFKPHGFELYSKDESLFNFGGAVMNFYRPPQLQLIPIRDYSELSEAILNNPSTPIWFFNAHSFLPEEANYLKSNCRIEFSTLPRWMTRFDDQRTFKRMTNWTLFRCSKNDSE